MENGGGAPHDEAVFTIGRKKAGQTNVKGKESGFVFGTPNQTGRERGLTKKEDFGRGKQVPIGETKPRTGGTLGFVRRKYHTKKRRVQEGTWGAVLVAYETRLRQYGGGGPAPVSWPVKGRHQKSVSGSRRGRWFGSVE